jgi:hypothetical protein
MRRARQRSKRRQRCAARSIVIVTNVATNAPRRSVDTTLDEDVNATSLRARPIMSDMPRAAAAQHPAWPRSAAESVRRDRTSSDIVGHVTPAARGRTQRLTRPRACTETIRHGETRRDIPRHRPPRRRRQLRRPTSSPHRLPILRDPCAANSWPRHARPQRASARIGSFRKFWEVPAGHSALHQRPPPITEALRIRCTTRATPPAPPHARPCLAVTSPTRFRDSKCCAPGVTIVKYAMQLCRKFRAVKPSRF